VGDGLPRATKDGSPMRSDAARTLLVASTGGHLDELVRLVPRFSPPVSDVEWVTHAGPQAGHLPANQHVHLVSSVAPRDLRHATANLRPALQILRRGRWDRVITTGAGVALPFVTAARMLRIPTVYIESAARVNGPSLTGSLLSHLRGVELYTQQRRWAGGRWAYRGSVFDCFAARSRPVRASARRVAVLLGTSKYPFPRAIDAVLRVLPLVASSPIEVTWQLGSTDVSTRQLPAGAQVASATVPTAELERAVARAELVIAHAGVGSALTALGAGKCPVLLPRLASMGEHVDDHQSLLAADLQKRGLAVGVRPEELTAEHLRIALSTAVDATPGSSFRLGQEA
jgi:UDP-N-acetylglucosamine--N-acetylmuramyl-(pentapeptide) pyrophosphoryl-undecaprenol N-acetylglucosamine transferase